jgi:hypothetical protein
LIGYLQIRPDVVARIKANPGQAMALLKSLQPGDVEIGRFFTKPGTPIDRLGIADQNRIYCRFRFKSTVSALESTASPIKDTWTVRAGGTRTAAGNVWRHGQFAGGGGTQFLIPEARFLHFTSNAFEIVDLGSSANLY